LKKKTNKGRGKPKEWTDEKLKEMALEVKYKNQGKKLTPSFLQEETGVGRNTWSRRMKEFITELNQPVLQSINISDNSEVTLPSMDLILKRYGKDKQALRSELMNIEILIYDLFNELKEYKLKYEKSRKAAEEIQSLKEELLIQNKRAEHYESLYNTIMVSSIYPHLQDEKKSKLYQLGIKDNLIDFSTNKERNTDLKNLSSHFPDVSDKTTKRKLEDQKRDKNMELLLNKFDI
jgi:hypothetical protein